MKMKLNRSFRYQYPHLAYFLAAYFHQDWMLDDPDLNAVVKRYLHDMPHRTAKATAQEIKHLLAADLPQPELQRALDEMGCAYDLSAGGLDADIWLQQLRDRLLIR
jgi:hypothetical protein